MRQITRMCRSAHSFASPRRDRITLVAGSGDDEPAVTRWVAEALRWGCFTGVCQLWAARSGDGLPSLGPLHHGSGACL